ncbi:hypothetical protein NTGHW29_740044 [Candidatus Nitrotoga sp. HW29]|nr:hypothetical protein NTGHW29_740044 [Candidatus Nitrotoga sp. HW29]
MLTSDIFGAVMKIEQLLKVAGIFSSASTSLLPRKRVR